MCVTDLHDMTLAVKVVLNPNTTNQPTNQPTMYFHFSNRLNEPVARLNRQKTKANKRKRARKNGMKEFFERSQRVNFGHS